MFGGDKGNPHAADKHESVFGQFAAIEVAYPIDWFTPKVSFLFSSGDANPQASQAHGFDGVFDNADFAGGNFTYWQRHAIANGNIKLKDNFTLFPSLRAKGATAPNAVNPGLLLYNVGWDAQVSNALDVFMNVNYLRFIHTKTVEEAFGLQTVGHGIGTDSSLGVVWRPLGIDNLFLIGGLSSLIPDRGLRDLNGGQTLLACFGELKAVF